MLKFQLPEKLTTYDYESIAGNSIIDPSEVFEKPEPIFFQRPFSQVVDIMTKGNISLIQGRAKSRKTFGMLFIISKILKTNINVRSIITVDTEQYKYHSSVFVRRLASMCPENYEKFSMFNVRKYSKEVRFQFIEDLIVKTKPDLIFIDNIRDIIKDFNDIGQSDTIITNLSQLAEEFGTHICCTLHQNKGDKNARGHLGSELTQKAETVFDIETEEGSEITKISGAYTRNAKFQDMFFTLGEGAIPYEVNENESKAFKNVF